MFTTFSFLGRQARVAPVLLILFCSAFCAAEDTSAQTAEQKTWLRARARELAELDEREQAEVQKLAARLGSPAHKNGVAGPTLELQRIEEGLPIFYITENTESAVAVSADKLWPGAGYGYALSGAGVSVGVWDGGGVRLDHQEFTGRVVAADGTTKISSHATHVAGTIAAAGADPVARGLAYNATILSNDWSRDRSEMAHAAANGLRVSNHSYGQAVGWVKNARGDGKWAWLGNTSVDSKEDYRFGHYDWMAQEWDDIAYHAPHYLMVKAAGNDRDDAPAPGEEHWVIDRTTYQWTLTTEERSADGGLDGYDTIIDAGNAKNILTVGAVSSIAGGYRGPEDVDMAPFSGWGPTDDGRIKPDVVTVGVGVYSPVASSSTAYTLMSGTSMAAPGATGSVALLVEHAESLRGGAPLLASTMKALVIHTADEAGPAPGPDYTSGWGLVNTLHAADVVTRDAEAGGGFNIREKTLAEGEQIEFEMFSSGEEPLRVTIAWTDPAGAASPRAVDPEVRTLVNDLDVTVTAPDGTVHYPWVLDPANPSAPATTGVNTRDNGEQVVIDVPVPGTYTVRVTFKARSAGKAGAASGTQNVSIIATGMEETNSGALPVELSRFEAGLDGQAAILRWATASETDNAGFEVEHALPGADAFRARGFVQGHGTGQQEQTYAFRVERLTPGTHRFRLKQIDFDGQAHYSDEIAVEVALPGQAHLSPAWPNPFNPQTRFTLEVKEAQAVQVAVFDALGRRVALLYDGVLEAGQEHRFMFTADAFATGVYLIRATGETFTQTQRATLIK